MALLTDSASRKRKRKPGSTAPGSSVPSSLPDSDSLKRIDSLERELAEAKASGEASKQEIENLKRQLEEAKAASTRPPSPSSEPITPPEQTKDSEPDGPRSFFGY